MKTAAVIFIMLVFVAVGYSRNILNPEGPYIEQLESEGRKRFCDYPGCTCFYYKDPCPSGYYSCSSTRYCTLRTNRPCCY